MAVLLAFCTASLAQSDAEQQLLRQLEVAKADSAVVHSLIALTRWNLDTYYPRAVDFATKAVENAVRSGQDALIAAAYTTRALTHWHNGEYDESVRCYNKSLTIQTEIGNPFEIGINYHGIAMNHYYQATYPQAIEFHAKALREFQNAGSKIREAQTLNHMGLVYHKIGDYRQAIYYLLESTKIKKNLPGYLGRTNSFSGDSPFVLTREFYTAELNKQQQSLTEFIQKGEGENILQTLYNIGTIYLELNHPDSAVLYCKQAVSQSRKIRKGPDYFLLGTAFLKSGAIDSAIYYHTKGIEVSKSRGTSLGLLRGYGELGDDFLLAGQMENALKYNLIAFELTQSMGNQLDMVIKLQKIAEILVAMGRLDEALQRCTESLELAKQISAKTYLKDAYFQMADILVRKDNFQEGFHFQQQGIALGDSIFAGEADLQFAQMWAKYDLESKEEHIKLLSQEKQLQQEKIRSKDQLIYSVIIGLGLLGMLAISTFRRYRLKNRANKILKEQKQQIEMLMMEIHHRVKNSLQVISSLINLKVRHATAETSEALNQLNGRIYSMSLVHEKLCHSEQSRQVQLDEYLVDISRHLIATFEDQEHPIHLDLDCDPVTVDPETVLTCGLIANELVANAVKYAFGGHQADRRIRINLRQEQSRVSFSISDNGFATKPLVTDFQKSFGLRFVDQLVKTKLKGEWNLAAEKDGIQASIRFSTASQGG